MAWNGGSLPFPIVRPHQAQDPVSTKLANTLVPLSGGEETEEKQIEIESPVQALTSTSSGTQEFPSWPDSPEKFALRPNRNADPYPVGLIKKKKKTWGQIDLFSFLAMFQKALI